MAKPNLKNFWLGTNLNIIYGYNLNVKHPKAIRQIFLTPEVLKDRHEEDLLIINDPSRIKTNPHKIAELIMKMY